MWKSSFLLVITGAVHISELLKVTHTLQVLSMWGNSVGDDGIAMISEALQHVKSLHRLAVSECGLSVKGTVAIRSYPVCLMYLCNCIACIHSS